jgi:hypothetical protein
VTERYSDLSITAWDFEIFHAESNHRKRPAARCATPLKVDSFRHDGITIDELRYCFRCCLVIRTCDSSRPSCGDGYMPLTVAAALQ